MEALEYLARYKIIYNARDTRRKFIPIERIGNDPEKYGFSELKGDLPDGYKSKAKQADFINDKAKITAAICANRAGKSEAAAVKFIKTLESIKRDRGARAWVLTESFDLQKSGIQEKLKIYLKPERIKPGTTTSLMRVWKSFDYLNKHGITIPVEFKTYEQGAAKLQAAKLYVALFDEEPPEDIYNEVRLRTVDLKAPIIMAFTPLKGFTWSHKRIFNAKRGAVSVYQWGMIDNPFIPREEIEDLTQDLSVKQYNMRILGKYQGAEGMIYESFDRELSVKPNLFDADKDVFVSVDWGVVVVAVAFFQENKITRNDGKIEIEYYLIDGFELEGVGYGKVMSAIIEKGYVIPEKEWFCDPAGRARSQATRTGMSLLRKIEIDYAVSFKYLKKLGVEESIDIVDSMFLNANGDRRLFIQEGIKLNKKGDTPQMRIEGYVRDDKTLQPVKDGINDHFADALRYGILNKTRAGMRKPFTQS